ncbi:MAG: DUF2924 domain-containing protein [Gammaproteobacteria bacterium]|nr:DUF2924 domain-containing protein [Gammaproteobacteria bacterium]
MLAFQWHSPPRYGRMDTMDLKALPELTEVLSANAPALRVMYQAFFQQAPPKWARADTLRGNLAWAIQAKCQGQSPKTLKRKLLLKADKQQGASTSPVQYQPGTCLIREWQGDTYEVTILEKGYLWQGNTYRSLSAISHAITGTRWSGPRFFGLKGTAQNEKTE